MDSVSTVSNQIAIFVGSLSTSTGQEGLIKYFSKFGSIPAVNLITDWATGVSKRCAIVFCEDEATCSRILSCKTHKLDGKTIRVTLADQEKKGTKKISTTNLFVGNIADRCTEDEIRNLFKKFGQIESVRFFRNASTKAYTKNAIIQYQDSRSVELAFKSKSEMGTSEESFKISPLKHKKTTPGGASKPDQMEEVSQLMLQMWQNNQQPLNQYLSEYEEQLGMEMSEAESEVPIRRHRKSSSVDLAPSSIRPQMNDHCVAGGNLFASSNSTMQKPYPSLSSSVHLAQMNRRFKKSSAPFSPRAEAEEKQQADTDTVIGSADTNKEEEKRSHNHQMITLIDLFDDEDDNISAAFYGASRRSYRSRCMMLAEKHSTASDEDCRTFE